MGDGRCEMGNERLEMRAGRWEIGDEIMLTLTLMFMFMLMVVGMVLVLVMVRGMVGFLHNLGRRSAFSTRNER